MTPINFKANFIRPVTIQKSDKPYQASFVELDPYDYKDLNTLSKLDDDWDKTLAHAIFVTALDISSMTKPANLSDRFFAITTQQNSFEKLEPKKVLGLAACKNRSSDFRIKFLQTHPKHTNPSPKKEKNCIDTITDFIGSLFLPRGQFKGVGAGMINSIKKETGTKPITLWSVEAAKDFYIKQGFEEKEKNNFTWNPNDMKV